MNNKIIDFYNGNGPDASGRKIEDIWLFDDIALEGVHDYIQWLFPLTEPSLFNKDAPLLDDETIQEFRGSIHLQGRLSRSVEVMLSFLRLKEEAGAIRPKQGEDLFWLSWKNHNFRRLTRIMTSLRLLGMPATSKALHECLCFVYNEAEHGLVIDSETLAYWKAAADGE